MKKLVFLLLLLFLTSHGFAEAVGASVDSINIRVVINSDLSVDEEIIVNSINTYSTNSSYMYFFLSDLPEDLTITDENNNEYNYTSFVANGIYTLRLIDELMPNCSKIYYFSYSNNDIVQKFDRNHIFSYLFTSYYNISDFSLELVLPRGFGITQKDINTVSPPSSRIFSDGQQIIIEWVGGMNYLDTNTYLVFFERLAFSNFGIGSLITAVIIGFIIGGGLTYYFLKRRRKEIVTMALTKDEKNIVDFILSNNNDVFQNNVGKELDFSKPKLSKIIHNLQDKNILSVSPSGRKNKLRVNKRVL